MLLKITKTPLSPLIVERTSKSSGRKRFNDFKASYEGKFRGSGLKFHNI
jgi:hypothetical protein